MYKQVITSNVVFASFWQRLGAFLVDVLPITLLIALLSYQFLGFDTTLHHYLETGRSDTEAYKAFLKDRNRVRLIATLVYLVYAWLMHASPWQATVGKKLFGIRVVDERGGRIRLRDSLRRSVSMLLSILPAFIGCLAMLWSETNQAWHDKIAGTYVIQGSAPHDARPDMAAWATDQEF